MGDARRRLAFEELQRGRAARHDVREPAPGRVLHAWCKCCARWWVADGFVRRKSQDLYRTVTSNVSL